MSAYHTHTRMNLHEVFCCYSKLCGSNTNFPFSFYSSVRASCQKKSFLKSQQDKYVYLGIFHMTICTEENSTGHRGTCQESGDYKMGQMSGSLNLPYSLPEQACLSSQLSHRNERAALTSGWGTLPTQTRDKYVCFCVPRRTFPPLPTPNTVKAASQTQ